MVHLSPSGCKFTKFIKCNENGFSLMSLLKQTLTDAHLLQTRQQKRHADRQTDRHTHTDKDRKGNILWLTSAKKNPPLLEKKKSCKAKHTFQKLIFTFLHKCITLKKKVSFQYIFVPFKTKYCLSKQIFLFLQGPGLCLCQWESLGQTCVFPIWRQSIAALVVRNTIKEGQHFALVVVIAWNLKPPQKQIRKEEETYLEKKVKNNNNNNSKQTEPAEPVRDRGKKSQRQRKII